MSPAAAGPEPAVLRQPAALTPDWLTAALRAGGHDVTVVRAGLPEPVGTGQMAACYRVPIEVAEPAPTGVPPTLVVKMPPADVDLGVVAAGAYRNEVAFYAELAPTVAIRVPTCFYEAYDDAVQGFTLLLADLAPARQGDQITGCTPDEARAALVNLAGLHGPRWCDPSLRALACMAEPDEADAALLAQVLVAATDIFCDRYADRLTADDVDVLRAVPGAIAAWSLARTERFGPVHGDYRLDNLLFPEPAGTGPTGPGGVSAVDWQTVSLGLPARDLAYFLATSLTVADRRAHEDALVAAYHDALLGHGVTGYPLELCADDQRFALLQGPLITVTGAAFSTRTDRGDDMFMAMASRACAAVRDHGTLDLIS